MTRLRICLVGASGYLGTRVAAEFRARELPVCAIMRDPNEQVLAQRLHNIGAEVAFVDASRHQSYSAALRGADIAISCMASRNRQVGSDSDFWAIDRDANIRFGLGAIASGAHRVILVATFEGPASRGCSQFSDAKEHAVETLAAACEAAGVSFSVIRPTAYFSDLTNRAFASVAARRRFTTIGDGSHRINPVDGADVAAFIADDALGSGIGYAEHPIGGPEVFTYRQIGELAGSTLGQTTAPRRRCIPIDGLRALAALTAAAGICSVRLRRSAAILHWMIYAGTHDAVAPSCGGRRLSEDFAAKAAALKFG